jgi:hypothetical protein
MPKKRMRATVAFSERPPEDLLAELKADGHELRRSASLLARELIQDLYSVYGVPRPVAEALDTDRQRRYLDWRQYLVELIGARYRELEGLTAPVSDRRRPLTSASRAGP